MNVKKAVSRLSVNASFIIEVDAKIPLYAPSRSLRARATLMIPAHHTRYGQNDPFLVSLQNINSYLPHFDFNMSLS